MICRELKPLLNAISDEKAQSHYEKRERGFWICRKPAGGLTKGESFAGSGKYVSDIQMQPDIACPSESKRVGMFHTHPTPEAEISGPDLSYAIHRDLDFVCIAGDLGTMCHELQDSPIRKTIKDGIQLFAEIERDLNQKIKAKTFDPKQGPIDVSKILIIKNHFDGMVASKRAELRTSCSLPPSDWRESFQKLTESYFENPIQKSYPELQKLLPRNK